MKFEIAAFSHAGNYKAVNEDRICWFPEEPLADERFMLCVADGMGGHRFPDLAADLFCSTAKNLFHESSAHFPQVSDFIDHCFMQTGAALQEKFAPHTRPAPGCAAILAICHNGLVSIGWIGDCRAYRISEEQIRLLTRDHTEAERMVHEGLLAQDQVQHSPARHILTRALTAENRDSHPEIISQTFAPSEILLLCSDGLTNEMSERQMHKHLAVARTRGKLAAAGNSMLEQVLAGRAADNISFLLCRF